MKKLLCAILCLGMLFGCSNNKESKLSQLKEVKLIDRDNAKQVNDIVKDSKIETDGSSAVKATYEKGNIRMFYTKDSTDKETIITTQINFDNYANSEKDTATYLARVLVIDRKSLDYSHKYVIVGRDGLELDLETNEKYERSDTIGELSVDEKIELLQVKEYYNDFVKNYNINYTYVMSALEKHLK